MLAFLNQHSKILKTAPVKIFRRRRTSLLPLDRALEVGLADRAVVDEYRRAGAVLFSQEPRGHLREKT